MKAKLGDYVKFYISGTLVPTCGRVIDTEFCRRYPYLIGQANGGTFMIKSNEIVRIYKDRYKKPSNKRSK